MFDELIRRWWILAGRGVVAIAFGVALFTARVETLGLLVGLFGVFALADGIFTVGAGLAVGWLLLFLEGIIGMAVGLFTFLYPPATQLWFIQLVVLWAVATGVLELVGAFRLVKLGKGGMTTGSWLLGLFGASSLAFGALMALRPELGSLTGLLGAYALVSGVLLVLLAFNVRTWHPLVTNNHATAHARG